jgi:hypothetical protein
MRKKGGEEGKQKYLFPQYDILLGAIAENQRNLGRVLHVAQNSLYQLVTRRYARPTTDKPQLLEMTLSLVILKIASLQIGPVSARPSDIDRVPNLLYLGFGVKVLGIRIHPWVQCP